jgi:hypothetical protein
MLDGGMAERFKAAVLKCASTHSGKFIKIKQILLPAKYLQRFSTSPDFTRFHPF